MDHWKDWKRIRVLFLLFVLSLWCILIFNSIVGIINQPSNECKMTYMYPNFFRIHHNSEHGGILAASLEEKVQSEYPPHRSGYELYLYRDGWNKHRSESALLNLTGVPVLFIPGNGGNFQQVRSLASESVRRTDNGVPSQSPYVPSVASDQELLVLNLMGGLFHSSADGSVHYSAVEDSGNSSSNAHDSWRSKKKKVSFPNHLDWFTVDFKEELSAFDRNIIQRQTDFVIVAIQKILELYVEVKAANAKRTGGQTTGELPSSVILVGHSMGGLVARSAVLHSQLPSDSVHTIITFASPHKVLPLGLQPSMASWFTELNREWVEGYRDCFHSKPCKLGKTVVVSIAGGVRDRQVRSGDTVLDGLSPPGQHISVAASSMPHVWLSTDHQSIVWCNQLMQQVALSLSSLIDRTTGQVMADSHARFSVLASHLRSPLPEALGWQPQPSGKNNLSQQQQQQQEQAEHGIHPGACPPSTTSWIVEPQDTDIFVQSEMLNIIAMDGRRRWMDIQRMKEKGRTHWAMVTDMVPCQDIRIHLWRQQQEHGQAGRRTQPVEISRKLVLIPADEDTFPFRNIDGMPAVSTPPPSALLLLQPEDMDGFRFVTITVAPKRVWAEEGAVKLAAYMSLAQFYNGNSAQVPVSVKWLTAATLRSRNILLEEGHPIATTLTFPAHVDALPLFLSAQPTQCGQRGESYISDPQVYVTNAHEGGPWKTGSCKIGCFPPTVISWSHRPGQEVVLNSLKLKPALLQEDSMSAISWSHAAALPWHNFTADAPTLSPAQLLIIADPHCSFEISVQVSLSRAVAFFVLTRFPQIVAMAGGFLLLSASLQAYFLHKGHVLVSQLQASLHLVVSPFIISAIALAVAAINLQSISLVESVGILTILLLANLLAFLLSIGSDMCICCLSIASNHRLLPKVLKPISVHLLNEKLSVPLSALLSLTIHPSAGLLCLLLLDVHSGWDAFSRLLEASLSASNRTLNYSHIYELLTAASPFEDKRTQHFAERFRFCSSLLSFHLWTVTFFVLSLVASAKAGHFLPPALGAAVDVLPVLGIHALSLSTSGWLLVPVVHEGYPLFMAAWFLIMASVVIISSLLVTSSVVIQSCGCISMLLAAGIFINSGKQLYELGQDRLKKH